jgi:hypothetical protein
MAVTFSNIVVGEGTIAMSTDGVNFVDLGATQDGAELAWEPDMVDIEIDQFGDAARVVTSKIKVSLKTKLAEGTLENLARAWNYSVNAEVTTGGGNKTLSVGIQSVYPVENAIRLVGTAPGSTATLELTRTYNCNRVIQYSSSSHMLKRAENTAFPVDFRLLPDPSQTGSEYGTIVDQLA